MDTGVVHGLVALGESLTKAGRVRSAALAFDAASDSDESQRLPPLERIRIRLHGARVLLKACKFDYECLSRIKSSLERTLPLVSGFDRHVTLEWLNLHAMLSETYLRLGDATRAVQLLRDVLKKVRVKCSEADTFNGGQWFFYFRFQLLEALRRSKDGEGVIRLIDENIEAAKVLGNDEILAGSLLSRVQVYLGKISYEHHDIIGLIDEADLAVQRHLCKNQEDFSVLNLRVCSKLLRCFVLARCGNLFSSTKVLSDILPISKLIEGNQSGWSWLSPRILVFLASHVKRLAIAASGKRHRELPSCQSLLSKLTNGKIGMDSAKSWLALEMENRGLRNLEGFDVSPEAMTRLILVTCEGSARIHLSQCNFSNAKATLDFLEVLSVICFQSVTPSIAQLKGEYFALMGERDIALKLMRKAKELSLCGGDIEKLSVAYLKAYDRDDRQRQLSAKGEHSEGLLQFANPVVQAVQFLTTATSNLASGFKKASESRRALLQCLKLLCDGQPTEAHALNVQVSSNALVVLAQLYLYLTGNTNEARVWIENSSKLCKKSGDVYTLRKSAQLREALHKRANEVQEHDGAAETHMLLEQEIKRRKVEALKLETSPVVSPLR